MRKPPMVYFKEISKIPRVSGNEKAVASYVETFAKDRNYQVYRDALHNIIVYKPATIGFETNETIMIQGHLDMVGAKEEGCNHDFDLDPIRLVTLEGRLHAEGTTLGADDGVAVAYMLAILDDPTLIHGPLECVFTVQEEIGLIGAQALDMKKLAAKKMINLDAGPESVFLTSCAGGCRISLEHDVQRESCEKQGVKVVVKGLEGGASGMQIQHERGNAICILGDMIKALAEDSIRLVHLCGGDKDNVIPDTAEMIFSVDSDILEKCQKVADRLQRVGCITDPKLSIEIEAVTVKEQLCLADSESILSCLYALPHGVMSYHSFFAGLPESSSNLAVVKIDEKASFKLSLRSSRDAVKEQLIEDISKIAQAAHFEMTVSGKYPGWAYEAQSELREIAIQTFNDYYHRAPVVDAIHAGLECGVFKAAIPELDILAMGPLYKEMHTPKEWLDIASFERTYCFITKLLENLCTQR